MLTDTHFALRGKWLYLTSAAALVVLLRPSMELIVSPDIWQVYDVMMYYSFIDAFTGLVRFIILFAVLLYSASFLEECLSGYAKYALFHTTARKYIISKMLAVCASGALATALPFAVVALIGIILFQPVTAQSLCGYYQNVFWGDMAVKYGAPVTLAARVFLAGLFGWTWSLTGLIVSTVARVRLSVYVLPLVAYQTLCTLLPDSLYHPIWLFDGNSLSYGAMWVPIAMQAGYFALFSMLSYLGMKRRLRNV